MLYPSIFVGATYNDNIHQSASEFNRDTGTSLRVSPRVYGTYDGGIHKTSVYGVADAEFFNADTVAASVGFNHSYAPLPDLTFGVFANYTRQTDLFNSALMFNNNAIGPLGNPPGTIPLIINPFGTTPNVNPIAYNQFTGGGSVTKDFGQFFTTLSATAYYIAYDHQDNIPDPFHTSHDGGALWLTGRVGYKFPSFYVFAEGSGIWQGFNNSLFNTDGYRVVGGIGSAIPGSLWQAEVWGGYQVQNQSHQDDIFHLNNQNIVSGISTDANSGVFGGSLSYYPTPYWTLIASVNETLGVSTFPNLVTPAGTPNLATTAILQSTYGLSRLWSVGVRAGYTRADYIGFSRLDNGWLVGASFNYEIWRNLMLTLDYQYSTNHSDVAFADFTRNQYTAGLTYRY